MDASNRSETVNDMIVDVLLDALKTSTSHPWSGEIVPIQLTHGHCMLWFKPQGNSPNKQTTQSYQQDKVRTPARTPEPHPQRIAEHHPQQIAEIPRRITSQTSQASQATPGLKYKSKGGSVIPSTHSSIPSVIQTKIGQQRSDEDLGSLNNLFEQDESITRDLKISPTLMKSSLKNRDSAARESVVQKRKTKSARDKVEVNSPARDGESAVSKKAPINLNVSGKDMVADKAMIENTDCLKFFNKISEEMQKNPFFNPTQEIEKHLKSCHLHRKADDEDIMQMRLARAVIKHNRKLLEKLETLRYSTNNSKRSSKRTLASEEPLDAMGVCPGGRCQLTKTRRSRGGSTLTRTPPPTTSCVIASKICPACCTKPGCECNQQLLGQCCPRPRSCSYSPCPSLPCRPSTCPPLLPPSCSLPCNTSSPCSMEVCPRPASTCTMLGGGSQCASCPSTYKSPCAAGAYLQTTKGGEAPCSNSSKGSGGAYANMSGICRTGACPYVNKSKSDGGALIEKRTSSTSTAHNNETDNAGEGEHATPTIEEPEENKPEQSKSKSNTESPCLTGACPRIKELSHAADNCNCIPRSQQSGSGCSSGNCAYASPPTCSSGACGFTSKSVQRAPDCASGLCGRASKLTGGDTSSPSSLRMNQPSPCAGGACLRPTRIRQTMNCPGGNCPYMKNGA